MLKNNTHYTEISGYNIIFPLAIAWNKCADFQKQTVEYIKKKNNCYVFLGADKKKFIKIKKVNNLFLFYPIGNFLKITYFEKIFTKINLIIFYLLVTFDLRCKKSINIIWLFNSEMNIFFDLFKKQTKIKIYDLVDFANLKNIFITAKKADLIFANSSVLYKFAKSISTNKIVQVPQGFDLDNFHNNKNLRKIKPSKKITITYIGSINFRLDFILLDNLIKENPKHDFVFWGPVEYLNQDMDEMYDFKNNIIKLKKYKNVRFGCSNRKGVLEILKKTDIGIIPYNTVLDFNRNCFPMKIFEYFYMGLPVISTKIEELYQYKKLIKISNNYKTWNNFINNIMIDGWSMQNSKQERQLAVNNSWYKKLNKIEEEIINFVANKNH